MAATARSSDASPPVVAGAVQRWLWVSRAALIAAVGLLLLLVDRLGTVALPFAEMTGLLTLQAGLLGFSVLQARQRQALGPGEMLLHLGLDAAILAALVYFSGGYANPFISLLLIPLILAAVALRGRQVWVLMLWVMLLYAGLARYYQPLRLELSDAAVVDLHLMGMGFNFALTAFLVTVFMVGLSKALHQRDAALARLREQALRDEQLFGLGMQAAAAAHDLATPLATLSLSLQTLAHEYAGDDELGPDLERMQIQATRMGVVLDRLAAAAGAARRVGAEAMPLDAWLRETFDHWRLMRPSVTARLQLASHPAPHVRAEPLLISLLATLLNNAADVSPDAVELRANWAEGWLEVVVSDRGPGFTGAAVKEEGWGIGLNLAQAAAERFGGQLAHRPRPSGGLDVHLKIPLARLRG